jgi:hypothetical protein
MRTITSLIKTETLKLSLLLCLLPFHNVTWNYFLGNSTNSKKVFYIQKKIIRIMTSTKREPHAGDLLKECNILPLASKLLLSLLSFVVDNIEKFQTNSYIHNISTRYRYNLHVPNTNLIKV